MKRIYYALFITALSLGSCTKQLEQVPNDLVVDENAFANVASLENGLVGAYATFNGTYDNDIYATTLYTDEGFLPTENTTGRGVNAYKWQSDPNTGEITAAWGAYYFGIDRANRILTAADKLTGSNATEEQTRLRIKGEAFALRAFGHLQLLINFADGYEPTALSVPYMTASLISKPQRLTNAEVFAKIKADLQSAAGLIPSSFTTRTRITLPAVYALQARAALYSKSWDEAITAATAAINAVPLANATQYASMWKDAANGEVIWKHKRNSGDVRLGDVFYDRSQQKIVYGVSSELLSTYAADDIRYVSTVLVRSAGRFSVGKYFGGDATQEGLSDVKIFRTAEMYLIRAEAYAEKNDFLNGGLDLNTLAAARITAYTPRVFTGKPALIDAIIAERFKELAFEGHRMGDLRRQKLPVTRLAADAINAAGSVLLESTNKVYYYPIPATEILANENIVQNTGYRK